MVFPPGELPPAGVQLHGPGYPGVEDGHRGAAQLLVRAAGHELRLLAQRAGLAGGWGAETRKKGAGFRTGLRLGVARQITLNWWFGLVGFDALVLVEGRWETGASQTKPSIRLQTTTWRENHQSEGS